MILTSEQIDTVRALIRDGAPLAVITTHPYSGAATCQNEARVTIYIVDRDGNVTYPMQPRS